MNQPVEVLPLPRQLKGLYSELRETKQLIILQGTPDPDAISSAMALAKIAEEYDIETLFLCFAGVSHPENRAMLKRLGIKLQKYDETVDLSKFSSYSIVDSQISHTPIDEKLKENGVKFLCFMDHHREESQPPPALLVDVREHVQSTAAIVTEYLKETFPKGLEPSDSEHVKLATSLVFGIRTDTNRFLSAGPAEYRAASWLAPCVDNHVIEVIERRVLTSSMLEIIEKGLVNRKVHDNFVFSDVGFVRSADRDAIPMATELLMSKEGTDTVLVYGIVDEHTVDGSFRTRSETINPDEFLKGFLGASPQNGRFYGGGNLTDKGGFQVPLGFLSHFEEREQVYAMTRSIIHNVFLEYIGKNAGAPSQEA